jgi:glycosyltransferase involved in cell wall biosynthesis
METLTCENSKILDKRVGLNVTVAPQVSVIIPTYNVSEFIAETLDSVFAQTFTGYEIILVNDGSPDTEKLEKAIAPYLEKIIYIKQKNSGAAAARNAAIDEARGEFLAFLDGDDIWFPEYLGSQLAAIEQKNCDLIYANAFLFGNVASEAETYTRKSPSRGEVSTESLIEGSCNLLTSGTIVRRENVVACGSFDETLPRGGAEDFDLWFRLAKSGSRLDYQSDILLKYRVRPNSLSGSNLQRAERSILALDLIEQKHELNDTEKNALEKRRAAAFAELELEQGKFHLAQENFAQAGAHFRKANEYYRRLKLTIIGALLKINPHLVLKLFKKMRPTDFTFAKPDKLNGNFNGENR